jgi:hypothetical protein
VSTDLFTHLTTISRAVLTHDRTYCSTVHFYFIRGMRAPQHCLHQKVNAIRNINKSLQKSPSDYTMVAVAVMTLLEVNLLVPMNKLLQELSHLVVSFRGAQCGYRSQKRPSTHGFQQEWARKPRLRRGLSENCIMVSIQISAKTCLHFELINHIQGRHLLRHSPPNTTQPRPSPHNQRWRKGHSRLHRRRSKRAAPPINRIDRSQQEHNLYLVTITLSH